MSRRPFLVGILFALAVLCALGASPTGAQPWTASNARLAVSPAVQPAVRGFQSDDKLPIRDTDSRLAQLQPTILDSDDGTTRRRELLLDQVALLGIDLLGGDQSVDQILEQV